MSGVLLVATTRLHIQTDLEVVLVMSRLIERLFAPKRPAAEQLSLADVAPVTPAADLEGLAPTVAGFASPSPSRMPSKCGRFTGVAVPDAV